MNRIGDDGGGVSIPPPNALVHYVFHRAIEEKRDRQKKYAELLRRETRWTNGKKIPLINNEIAQFVITS